MRSSVAIVAVVLLLGSCGGSAGGHSASGTTVPTRGPVFSGGTTAVSAPVAGPGKLTAVRNLTQSTFERVIFEFGGPVPGYSVGYVNRPVREDGSGNDVAVQGDSVLEVRMEYASAVDLSGGKVTATYTGPKRIAPGGPAVAELVEVGDFEGLLRWVVGTHGHPPFAVSTFTSPSRIVVDISTAAS